MSVYSVKGTSFPDRQIFLSFIARLKNSFFLSQQTWTKKLKLFHRSTPGNFLPTVVQQLCVFLNTIPRRYTDKDMEVWLDWRVQIPLQPWPMVTLLSNRLPLSSFPFVFWLTWSPVINVCVIAAGSSPLFAQVCDGVQWLLSTDWLPGVKVCKSIPLISAKCSSLGLKVNQHISSGFILWKSQNLSPWCYMALPQTPNKNYELKFSSQHISVTLETFT